MSEVAFRSLKEQTCFEHAFQTYLWKSWKYHHHQFSLFMFDPERISKTRIVIKIGSKKPRWWQRIHVVSSSIWIRKTRTNENIAERIGRNLLVRRSFIDFLCLFFARFRFINCKAFLKVAVKLHPQDESSLKTYGRD